MDVPRLGVVLELQLLAYTTTTATRDLSHICHLCCSLRQHQILNPLSKTWLHPHLHRHWATMGHWDTEPQWERLSALEKRLSRRIPSKGIITGATLVSQGNYHQKNCIHLHGYFNTLLKSQFYYPILVPPGGLQTFHAWNVIIILLYSGKKKNVLINQFRLT